MILVDSLTHYAKSPLGPRSWCHMVSDTSLSELHAAAEAIGMKRAWFQGDHYDLIAKKRAAAIKLGAQEVTGQELVKRMVGPRGDRMREMATRRHA